MASLVPRHLFDGNLGSEEGRKEKTGQTRLASLLSPSFLLAFPVHLTAKNEVPEEEAVTMTHKTKVTYTCTHNGVPLYKPFTSTWRVPK